MISIAGTMEKILKNVFLTKGRTTFRETQYARILVYFSTSSLDFTSFREAPFAYCQHNRFSFDNAPIENLMNVYKMILHNDDICLYDWGRGVLGWVLGFGFFFFFSVKVIRWCSSKAWKSYGNILGWNAFSNTLSHSLLLHLNCGVESTSTFHVCTVCPGHSLIHEKARLFF